MARFKHTTQKYDENGNKVPKGINGLKTYTKENPGVTIFDSKSEYDLHCKLTEMEKSGEIFNLKCKELYALVPKRKWWNNIKQKFEAIREINYIADFTFEREGNFGREKVVVDCKGWKLKIDKKTGKEKYEVYYDDIYKLKKKLLLWIYPDIIFEEM